MSNVIPFPRPAERDPTLAVDVLDIMGNRVGAHLTEHGEIALFFEVDGRPVGGLLPMTDSIKLRDALATMIDATFCGYGPGAA